MRSLLISVPLGIIVILVVDESWVRIAIGAALLLTLLDIGYLTISSGRRVQNDPDPPHRSG